jgi:hypothetical protein
VAGTPLLVRATQLDGDAKPVEYRLTELSGSIAEGTAIYAAPVRLPRTGSWLITAQAGANWGCFLYTLK